MLIEPIDPETRAYVALLTADAAPPTPRRTAFEQFASALDGETPAGRRYLLGAFAAGLVSCGGPKRDPRATVEHVGRVVVDHADDINEGAYGL